MKTTDILKIVEEALESHLYVKFIGSTAEFDTSIEGKSDFLNEIKEKLEQAKAVREPAKEDKLLQLTLPKNWAVLNDDSEEFKETVLTFINNKTGSAFIGDTENGYYGMRDINATITPDPKREEILTIEEFKELTKED